MEEVVLTRESEGQAPTGRVTQPSPDPLCTKALQLCSKMVPQSDSIMIEPVLTPFWRPINADTALSVPEPTRKQSTKAASDSSFDVQMLQNPKEMPTIVKEHALEHVSHPF